MITVGQRLGPEGWTLIHQRRAQVAENAWDGVWLGTREDGRWIVGRMLRGTGIHDGFRDGEWSYSKRFAGVDAPKAALAEYLEMAKLAGVFTPLFGARAGQAVDHRLAVDLTR